MLFNIGETVVLHSVMIRLIRHIVLGSLAVFIIAATGGYGLFQHYCSCDDNRAEIRLSESPVCDDSETNSCCPVQKDVNNTDCCPSVPADRSGSPCQGDDCCSHIYTYLKTDQVNLIDGSKSSFKFYTAYQVVIAEKECISEIDGYLHLSVYDRLPPPKFGKELLYELSQLKSAPFLA